MSLVRWNPFSEVDTVFNRMSQGGMVNWPRFTLDRDLAKKLEWTPSADISETEKEYTIRAELPAVQKEDLQVTLDDGVITIRGDRKHKKDEKTEKFHRVETVYGTFERSFSLPNNVNAEMIRCESKDGILTVHIPKFDIPKHKPKQIEIK